MNMCATATDRRRGHNGTAQKFFTRFHFHFERFFLLHVIFARRPYCALNVPAMIHTSVFVDTNYILTPVFVDTNCSPCALGPLPYTKSHAHLHCRNQPEYRVSDNLLQHTSASLQYTSASFQNPSDLFWTSLQLLQHTPASLQHPFAALSSAARQCPIISLQFASVSVVFLASFDGILDTISVLILVFLNTNSVHALVFLNTLLHAPQQRSLVKVHLHESHPSCLPWQYSTRQSAGSHLQHYAVFVTRNYTLGSAYTTDGFQRIRRKDKIFQNQLACREYGRRGLRDCSSGECKCFPYFTAVGASTSVSFDTRVNTSVSLDTTAVGTSVSVDTRPVGTSVSFDTRPPPSSFFLRLQKQKLMPPPQSLSPQPRLHYQSRLSGHCRSHSLICCIRNHRHGYNSSTTAVDEIRAAACRQLYHPEQLISDKKDATINNYRGHCTIGKETFNLALLDRVSTLVDNCTGLQDFLVYHATGALPLDRLSVGYGENCNLAYAVAPAPQVVTAIVELYNHVLTTHSLLERTDVTFCLGDEAVYDVCHRCRDVERPKYTNSNRIIAQITSSLTASLRFDDASNVDITEFQTNLVSYPRTHVVLASIISASRLHFSMIGFVPWTSRDYQQYRARQVFDSKQLVCDADPHHGRYLAVVCIFRDRITTTTRTPVSFDTTTTRTPVSFDTITTRTPVSFDTITARTPVSFDTITARTPVSLDTITACTSVSFDTKTTRTSVSLDTITMGTSVPSDTCSATTSVSFIRHDLGSSQF